MPLVVTWPDFAARLVVAIVAGALIGLNRGESGNAAGLRTTLLVCLAACLAMLQVNVLLVLHGKPQDSFVMLDLMRLPLGILSGVGFIGAGSILRKDGLVQGVTTAATMWYVTVIGLCAGGGQYVLAIAGTLLGLVVLHTLEHIEHRLRIALIAAVRAARGIGGRKEPVAVRLAAEQRGEAGFAVETRPAEPVDRAIASEQRRAAAIAKQCVIFNEACSDHGLLATRAR